MMSAIGLEMRPSAASLNTLKSFTIEAVFILRSEDCPRISMNY